MQDILSVALRALSFVFLLQAAGVALFVAMFGRLLAGSRGAICRLGRWTVLLALVCVTGHFTLEAARMAGELSGMWDLSLQRIVAHSTTGTAFALQVLGLSVIALGLWGDGSRRVVMGMLGVAIAIASFALTGHTTTHPERWILAPLLFIHLLIIAFWFGALLPLYRVSARETLITTARLVESFSAWATWLVPVILLAGVTLAVLLLPGLAALGQPYGELLLVKLAGFAALMALASMNKWRLSPAIARQEPSAVVALQRSVVAEYVLIAGVFTTTAVMTTFFSPEI